MKNTWSFIKKNTGTENFKWYHWAILLYCAMSFMLIVADTENIATYIFTIPNFIFSCWAVSRCPMSKNFEM